MILHTEIPTWNDYDKTHDDVIKWRHFLCYWSFVRGIHRWLVDSPHKGQWHRAYFFFICAWTNSWANNQEASDLRCHHAHYDVIIMTDQILNSCSPVQAMECHNIALYWCSNLTLPGGPSLLRLRRKLLRSSTRMRLLFWFQSGRGLDCSTSLPRGLRPIAAEPQSAQAGTMEQSSTWAKICHFSEVGHRSRSLAAFFFRKFLGD